MLRQIALRNVRTFDKTLSVFNLPPLTVFCGTNGSGKSTVLKSLLLVRQSQGANEVFRNSGKRQGMLRFVGSQVDFGDYSALVSGNTTSKDINIRLVVDCPSLRRIVSRLPRNVEDRSIRRYTGSDYNLSIDLSFKALNNDTQVADSKQNTNLRLQGILKSAEFSVVAKDRELASWRVKLFHRKGRDPQYKLHIPADEIGAVLLGQDVRIPASGLTHNVDYGSADIVLNGLFPSYILTKIPSVSPLPLQVSYGIRAVSDALNGINYLAPLRTASKRYYLAEDDVSPDLDPRGEFLPYILSGITEAPEVEHVPPGQKTIRKQNLRDALNGWLRYLNTGAGFNAKSRSDEFVAKSVQGKVVEINLKGQSGTGKHSISDSGFGYSQVLPILVRGLMVSPGSTLIVEQPELHLNPALQVRLADFFVSMTLAGKQVIIETHSEHIVNTIRVRAATDSGGFLSSNSVIYFLDNEKGQSVTHELSIQEDGTVPGWPRNFFGEAIDLSGQLLRAQIRYLKIKEIVEEQGE